MKPAAILLFVVWASVAFTGGEGARRTPFRPDIPPVWNEAALAEWATPLAGLDARPTHMSPAESYATPVDEPEDVPRLRAGPRAGRLLGDAAEGWAQTLARTRDIHQRPPTGLPPASASSTRRTPFPFARYNPALIAELRDPEAMRRRGADVLPDGTLPEVRWVPTGKGVALGTTTCSSCHVQWHRDGSSIPGAPPAESEMFRRTGFVSRMHAANRVVRGQTPFVMASEMPGDGVYQAWGVPWLKNDAHRRAGEHAAREAGRDGRRVRPKRRLPPLERQHLLSGEDAGPHRNQGSQGTSTTQPTHQMRGVADIMRYAALVRLLRILTDFGSHRFSPRRAARRFFTKIRMRRFMH